MIFFAENLDEMEFIIPTVPLILCRDKVYDLKLNVSYNNTINLRNTHLLYYYSQGKFIVHNKIYT